MVLAQANGFNAVFSTPTVVKEAAQTFTATLTDLGTPIECLGFKTLCVYFKHTIGTSTGCKINFLNLLNASSSEYTQIVLAGTSLSLYTITAASGLYCAKYALDGVIPFVQLQIVDAASGNGTIEGVYAVLSA